MKVIPASDIKRVNIQLSLQGETFSKTLEDKSSEAHKILKKKVTVALETILDAKLGHGEYKIVDVSFRPTFSRRDMFWRRRPTMDTAGTEPCPSHRTNSLRHVTPFDWSALRNMAKNESRHGTIQGTQTPALSLGGSRHGTIHGAQTPSLSLGGSRHGTIHGAQTPSLSRGGSRRGLRQEAQTPSLSRDGSRHGTTQRDHHRNEWVRNSQS
ncbi:hypothetical protein LSAT2_027290 [Lamellibrachia satsuma]|nr:hypothetical protein LSAT2_027290 [Lamellibrachia satsuma]